MKSLPAGSNIQIEVDGGYDKIVIPCRVPTWGRWFGGIFLLGWLAGWAFALNAAVNELFAEDSHAPEPMLIVWLVVWTLGGFFAVWMVIKIFKGPQPETILLGEPYMTYDPGTPAIRFGNNTHANDVRLAGPVDIDMEDLKTLQLREFGGRNRLTVDVGADRVALGVNLGEIEREWLYAALREHYRLD